MLRILTLHNVQLYTIVQVHVLHELMEVQKFLLFSPFEVCYNECLQTSVLKFLII